MLGVLGAQGTVGHSQAWGAAPSLSAPRDPVMELKENTQRGFAFLSPVCCGVRRSVSFRCEVGLVVCALCWVGPKVKVWQKVLCKRHLWAHVSPQSGVHDAPEL